MISKNPFKPSLAWQETYQASPHTPTKQNQPNAKHADNP
jgi:hypothetical protein